jgi:6,7-dimethyl-8-ribityllumazine synthase
MPQELTGQLIPGDHRIAVAVGRFNEFITRHLLDGCTAAWQQLGGVPENLTVAHVPGSFELPVTALKLAESGDYAAVICLGCVIRGETDHYDHVVEQTAKGVKDVGVQTGVPCIFGVLTCDTLEQAIHRAGAKMGNAGRSALMTAVEMADLLEQIGAEGPRGRGAE